MIFDWVIVLFWCMIHFVFLLIHSHHDWYLSSFVFLLCFSFLYIPCRLSLSFSSYFFLCLSNYQNVTLVLCLFSTNFFSFSYPKTKSFEFLTRTTSLLIKSCSLHHERCCVCSGLAEHVHPVCLHLTENWPLQHWSANRDVRLSFDLCDMMWCDVMWCDVNSFLTSIQQTCRYVYRSNHCNNPTFLLCICMCVFSLLLRLRQVTTSKVAFLFV